MTILATGTGKTDEQPTRFWEKVSLVAEISALCRCRRPDESTFVQVLELIQKIIPFDAASMYLLNGEREHLEERAMLGETVSLPSFLTRQPGEASKPWIASTVKPVLLKGPDKDFDGDEEFGSIMAVPLVLENQVIGMMCLGSSLSRGLQDKHVKLMSIVADQLAVSIERLNYIAEIEAKNDALHRAHEELQIVQGQIIAGEKLQVVTQLAASVNHEINNPLAVVVGNVQCLQLEMPDASDKVKNRLHRIEEAALRVAEINHKLLEIDSIETEIYIDSVGISKLKLPESLVESTDCLKGSK